MENTNKNSDRHSEVLSNEIAHKDHHIYVKRPCCYSNTGLLVLILIAPHENEHAITT
jgi:hypothetical protein